jgi:PBP1b-binding outer membrane lipoprotein LpoB
MGLMNVSTIVLAVLFTAGCAQSDPPEPPKKQGTVFDPMVKQLDRARDVQNVIDQSAQHNRDAVDKQERGDPSQ